MKRDRCIISVQSPLRRTRRLCRFRTRFFGVPVFLSTCRFWFSSQPLGDFALFSSPLFIPHFITTFFPLQCSEPAIWWLFRYFKSQKQLKIVLFISNSVLFPPKKHLKSSFLHSLYQPKLWLVAFPSRRDRHPRVQSLHRAGDSNCGRLLGAGHRADAQVLITAEEPTLFTTY